ncbi:ATP/GTP-binding protein [Streptomyces sp. NPDC005863]|uniref:ATP/GTP-binding protein n=1 Tax=unclassified Streptomyces TaxID=2593676 RepID=UPI0033E8D623
MDTDGTHGARDGKRAVPAPHPAPPTAPAPPIPRRPPGAQPSSTVAEWLAAPRPEAAPGVWRYGHRPSEPEAEAEGTDRRLIVGMVISALLGLLFWSLWRQGSVPYQWAVLKLFTPGDWWWAGSTQPKEWRGAEARIVYDGVVFGALVYTVGRLGAWSDAIRHYVVQRPQPSRAVLASVAAVGALVYVWPSALGLDIRPLPVADPVFSFVALVVGLDFFTSPVATDALYALITLAVLWPFARIGGWWQAVREARGATGRRSASPPRPAGSPVRAHWPELRAAGCGRAADLLSAEVISGRMNDVDCARIMHAWRTAASDPVARETFVDTVVRQGATAWTHPSGQRDVPARAATHDLLVRQVRIGRFAKDDRNPYAVRGVGAALGPEALGTSLLAVGPSGAGKTGRLMRPVAESLALGALTGQCAVVVVCAAGTALGADDAYDVVVKPGDPASVHDLDLYADCVDPDEAAAFLAEGLVGDLEAVDTRRAATSLAQLLGPYHAAHGRFPPVPVLRELLEGDPAGLAALQARLTPGEHAAMRRELDARMRQAGSPNDPGPALADRLALLDRSAFADFFNPGGDSNPFSMRAVVHHPLRVRVDLPEHGHEEGSRLLARLLLAQFTHVVRGRTRRPHFACLILDDASRTLTAESVRAIQRLRSLNAGVVLGLRTIGEVPEALQGPLYAAVGCRMAFSGVTTWDGRRFTEAWGTEWIETKEVAQHTVFADQPMTRMLHSLRKLVTGKAVTTDAVTVRRVERERWSASDLAHSLPPGHAVLSLTTVGGDHAPPLLVDLRDQVAAV